MPRIGPMELVLILLIVLIVFGAGRLPQIGGAIGKSIQQFKKSQRGDDEEDKPQVTKTDATAASDQVKK